MTVRVEAVRRSVAPVADLQGRQLPCACCQSQGMLNLWFKYEQVQLSSWYSIRRGGIGKPGTEQPRDPCLRYQPQDASGGKRKLRHSRHMKSRRDLKDLLVEGSRSLLVSYVQDEVGFRGVESWTSGHWSQSYMELCGLT